MTTLGSQTTYATYYEMARRRSTVTLRISVIVWDDSYAWVEDTRGKGFIIWEPESYEGRRTIPVTMGIDPAKDLLSHLDYYAGQFGPDQGVDRNLKQAYRRAAASVRQQMARQGLVGRTGRIGY
jgi:hypothetical protein